MTARPLAGRLLVAGLALLPLMPATAQSKATLPWAAAAGGQFTYLSTHDHALLLRARVERSFEADYNSLGRPAGGGLAQQLTVLAGYEWRLGERWSGGLIENVTFDPGAFRTFRTGGFLRHCGHIGAVQFRKRALAEHVGRWAGGEKIPAAGRIRLRVDLDRVWRAGSIGLRPRLAYELQFDVALQKQDAATKDGQRTADRAVLRLELALELTDRLSVVPYVARRTEFITAVALTDTTGAVRVPAGPRNLRFPVVGVDVRYTLPIGPPRPAGRDLPTYEGYQD